SRRPKPLARDPGLRHSTGMSPVVEGRFIDVLPALQAVAARFSGPLSNEHPGQLAWSSVNEGREAPAVAFGDEAYGFLESPHWLEVGGDANRAAAVIDWARARTSGFKVMALDGPLRDRLAELGGVAVPGAPWFTQQTADLAAVTVPQVPGYHFRHVERNEAAARAACHRAAWSDEKPSRMTEQMYEWLWTPRTTTRGLTGSRSATTTASSSRPASPGYAATSRSSSPSGAPRSTAGRG